MSTNSFDSFRTAVDDPLPNILCDRKWQHDFDDGCNLIFYRDGTGEMNAIGPMGLGAIFFTALQWKTLPAASIDSIMDDKLFKHNNILTRQPSLVCCSRLELTLLNNIPASQIDKQTGKPRAWGKYWHDSQFAQSALLPRQFMVVIEQGNFSIYHEGGEKRFELRLTFDVPPWPTFDGLSQQNQKRGVMHGNFELLNSTRAFYAEQLNNTAFEVRASNNDLLLGYKMTNCVMS